MIENNSLRSKIGFNGVEGYEPIVVRGSRPSPILCCNANALKRKLKKWPSTFAEGHLVTVGVEGFERQRPTVPDPLLVTQMR